MMHIPPSEAKRLSYWEFRALRYEWNDRHKPADDTSDVEPPSVDFVRARQAELQALGISGTKHGWPLSQTA